MEEKDILNEIEEATKEGRLWEPEQLVDDLLLSLHSDFRQRQVILGQVALAVDKVDEKWLQETSGFCYQNGFGRASDGWIERHIGVIPSWAYSKSGKPTRPRWGNGLKTSGSTSGTSRCHPDVPSSGRSNPSEGASGTSRRHPDIPRSGRSKQSEGASATSRRRPVRRSGDISSAPKRALGTSRSHLDSGKSVQVQLSKGASGTSRGGLDSVTGGKVSYAGAVKQGSVSVKGRQLPDREDEDIRRKRLRNISPILWGEKKVQYGRGCWQCGEWGHFRSDCPQWRERARPKESKALETKKPAESQSKVGATSTSGSPQEKLSITVKPASEEQVATETPSSNITRVRLHAEGSSTSTSRGGKPSKFKACPVPWCQFNFANKKGHIFGYHYPTALAKEDGKDTRTDRRVEALDYLARALVGPEASIDDLLKFLNGLDQLNAREECEVDEWTDGVVVNVARALGLVAPRRPTCVPLNSPGCIFQYRIMLEVVILLGERGHYEFMHRFGLPEKREELEARCPKPAGEEVFKVPSPLKSLKVVTDKDGRREVMVESEEPCSISAGVSEIKGEEDQAMETCSTSVSEIIQLNQPEEESCSTSVATPEKVEHETVELGDCSTSALPESDICSTSANARTQVTLEVSKEEYSSDGAEVHSLSDSSECSSPRRSWRPLPSPELSTSDMEVVDEVEADEVLEVDPSLGSGIDSHFHLDRTCAVLQIRPWDYKKALERLKPGRPEERVNVSGAVAVWCDPDTYPTPEQVASLREKGVVSAIGIHPSNAYQPGVLKRLEELLDTCSVVGLGEIGLDGLKRNMPLQRKVFDEALRLLVGRPNLVLVLHCRPRKGESSTSAYFDMFYRCKAIVPQNQQIHLHCFNGTMEDVDLWLGYFPNTHFGYSLMVKRNFPADSRAALQRLHSSRLLLESDAPYFKCDHRERWSSPAFIGLTAQEVAKVRGCSQEELLRVTAENARRLYWQ